MSTSLKATALFGLCLIASQLTGATPVSKSDGTCTKLNQRRAWSALADSEKKEYIRAELCLMNSAPKLEIEGALTRWDEVMYGHIVQSNFIHDVGGFLPWHRLYMRAHEILLQTECNYTGTQPYWDELNDSNSAPLNESSVFDTETGFGNGDLDDNGCITTGPFVNLTMHINQTSNEANYCLTRSLNQNGFDWANSTYLDVCIASENYTVAFPCYSSHPHTAGHSAVGGTMLDIVASPGDPLFFLHHTYLDRAWWQWQELNLTARLTDMAGQNVPTTEYLAQNSFEYPSDALLDYDGDGGNVTTLNHVLWMVGLIPNATIADVMDIRGDLICAEYI